MASKFARFGTGTPFRSIARLSLFPKPFPSSTLRFFPRRFCSFAAVAAEDRTELVSPSPPSPPPHPWPEWIEFVDRLTAKGYLTESVEEIRNERLYKDINLLKEACLSFSRDRYDIFKSLSTKDIEVVVGGGCPNLLRKAVNSAKRLRAHINLDEADVCSACNLRDSCDRAYAILNDSETEARTVDIVRVLMFYALDPAVISGGEKTVGRELVEASAKKLLSELLQFSEIARHPALAKPVAKVSKKMERKPSMINDKGMKNTEMRRGEWICHKCNFLNFSRNLRCLKCNENNPTSFSKSEIVMSTGGWICPECSFHNFSRNNCCLKCKAVGPNTAKFEEGVMKKGDWNCPKCQFMNFASNRDCLRCHSAPPKRDLNPGEWECPSCDYVNFRRNTVCRRCSHDRPTEAEIFMYDEDEWLRPR